MDSGKAVEEVGQWREALGKDLENISFDKRGEYLNSALLDFCIDKCIGRSYILCMT